MIIAIAMLLAILYCIVVYLTDGKYYAAAVYAGLITTLAVLIYFL